jgi:acylphosphatase
MKADGLGLRGFCFNAPDRSVRGYLEGPEVTVNQMANWLATEGSPKSVITLFDMIESKPIKAYSCESFQVIHPPTAK